MYGFLFFNLPVFKYRLKSRPNPLQMYSATRKFPLCSRSRVRIRVGVSSRIILKSSNGCATLDPNQSGRI